MAFDCAGESMFAEPSRCEIPSERIEEILGSIRRQIREERALERQLLDASSRKAA